MYPFQNILFTTDFSPSSKSALKYAAAFARKHGATLYIHNAQEGSLPPQALRLSDRALAENGYDWVMAIKKEMEELANNEILDGLKVKMILSEGRAVAEIPRVVREYNIDLVTMGTSVRAGVGGGVGSTSLSVMAQIKCPILFARPSMHDFVFYKGTETNIALNRILFATDFTEHDISAKRAALELARTHQAQLIVLHSVGGFLSYLQALSFSDLLDIEARVRKDVQARLDKVASEAAGVKTETIIAEGRPYDELLRLAVEKDIDLIVVGSGRVRSVANPLPGRNAERVVRGAPCPVLSVHSDS